MKFKKIILIFPVFLLILLLSCSNKNNDNVRTLLNVSYDPTRELYQEYNQLFKDYWFKSKHEKIEVKQSHGGSSKQALSVIDGILADVVSLALASDINAIYQQKKLLKKDWQQSFDNNSVPYYSTIVFLVRKGNPKNIKEWDDLIKPEVQIITPNPKTSGGAKWSFLAAWIYAKNKNLGNEEKAKEFVTKLYNNAPILDTGARGSAISFIKRKLGDVLLSWENEAYLAVKDNDDFEIIIPSVSILCEPPIALIDEVVDKKGTRDIATAYLKYLYSEKAQRIIAKNFYRPRNINIANEFKDKFKYIPMFKVKNEFNSWDEIQNKFFSEGGIFDQIYLNKLKN